MIQQCPCNLLMRQLKSKILIADEENPNLRLRVYITGGGCSGFQYGFTFDDAINDGDMTIEKKAWRWWLIR